MDPFREKQARKTIMVTKPLHFFLGAYIFNYINFNSIQVQKHPPKIHIKRTNFLDVFFSIVDYTCAYTVKNYSKD